MNETPGRRYLEPLARNAPLADIKIGPVVVWHPLQGSCMHRDVSAAGHAQQGRRRLPWRRPADGYPLLPIKVLCHGGPKASWIHHRPLVELLVLLSPVHNRGQGTALCWRDCCPRLHPAQTWLACSLPWLLYATASWHTITVAWALTGRAPAKRMQPAVAPAPIHSPSHLHGVQLHTHT